MALGFTKPRLSPIAIDFGSDTLKVLQLSLGDAPQLVARASKVIPELYRSEGAGRQTYLADTLRDLLKCGQFKGKRAICSIPAYQTLILQVEIPKSDAGDFDSQVGMHLIQRYDVDPSRMVIRSHKLGKIVRDGETLQQVICIAARRDAVMKYIELAHRCKLEVVGMHSEPVAVVRAHPMLAGNEAAGSATCYIDIGAGMTKLVVAHGQEMAFAKTVQVGGDQLTREYSQMRGIGFDQARTLRVEQQASVVSASHVAVSSASPAIDDSDDDLEADSVPVVSSGPPTDEVGGGVKETLIDELRLSLRYYQTTFPDKPIRQLVFLGGESQDIGLCQTIAKSVRIAAKLGDPFAGVDTADEVARGGGMQSYKPMPGWAVPLGLCYSEANL